MSTEPNERERTPVEYFPPGEYIADELRERGIDTETFAKLLRMDHSHFVALLNGKHPLTPSLAERVAQLFGSSVTVWLNLEMAWKRRPKV